jgi:uncharacterized heparinase superfamily protein
MPARKINLIWNTVRHLSPSQAFYQVWYRFQKRRWKSATYKGLAGTTLHPLPAVPSGLIPSDGKYRGGGVFRFLNLEQGFGEEPDWNWNGYGKLWNYNLQYFDYLHDAAVPDADKRHLIGSFSRAWLDKRVMPEPYPVSLRLINWALYFSTAGTADPDMEECFRQQADYLQQNLEFHIRANHLLENYYALVVAGLALQHEGLFRKGHAGMLEQLREQTLSDGAHCECSPMYHQIILSRLLLVIALLKGSGKVDRDFTALVGVASRMRGWMEAFRFADGSFAPVNDATTGIAPTYETLSAACASLDIPISDGSLGVSGYRRWNADGFEWMLDVGDIMPSYQPGHAHSDMLSLVMRHQGRDILVDTGISTYQTDARRESERCTKAHNTVTVGDANQSQVWGSFRVGRRANMTIREESPGILRASHDGYRSTTGVDHERRFSRVPGGLDIRDRLTGKKGVVGKASFHFDHALQPRLGPDGRTVEVEGLAFRFSGQETLTLGTYDQALGYNLLAPATVLDIVFTDELNTNIRQS